MPKSRSRRRPAPRRGPHRRPASTPVPAVTATGLRGTVERRSAPVLAWLSARPRLLLPLLSLALLVAGFAAPPAVGVPLLVLLVLVVAWLTYLSWPVIAGGARAVRLVTLGLLLVAVAMRAAAG